MFFNIFIFRKKVLHFPHDKIQTTCILEFCPTLLSSLVTTCFKLSHEDIYNDPRDFENENTWFGHREVHHEVQNFENEIFSGIA